MKNFILLFTVLLIAPSFSMAQITFSQPTTTSPFCPNESIFFSFKDTVSCGSYIWTVENGTASSNTTTEKWNYVQFTEGKSTGKVTVKRGNSCDSGSNSITIFLVNVINITPTINGSDKIDYGGSETYSVDDIAESVLKESYVSTFFWKVPSGWKVNGYTSNDNYIQAGYSAEITPTCSGDGTIYVYGVTSKCNQNTQIGFKNITRKFPDYKKFTYPEKNWIEGDTSPITMGLPPIECADYSWSLPDSWTYKYVGGENKIEITPDGCSGTVSCTVTVGSENKTYTHDFEFEQFDKETPPRLGGSSFVCDGLSTIYTINNLPGFTGHVNWSVGSNLTIVSQTNDRLIVGANGNGMANITAVIVSKCGSQHTLVENVSVGKPVRPYIKDGTDIYEYDQVGFDLTYGSSTTSLLLQMIKQGGAPEFTGLSIENITGNCFEIIESDFNLLIINPTSSGVGSFRIRGVNPCGNSEDYTQINLTISFDGYPIELPKLPTGTLQKGTNTTDDLAIENVSVGMNVFPNPVKSEFYVNVPEPLDNNTTECNLYVYNSIGEQVIFKEKFTMSSPVSTSKLTDGLYIVVLYLNGQKYISKISIHK